MEQELCWNDQVDKTAVGYLGQMKVKTWNEEQGSISECSRKICRIFEEMAVFRGRSLIRYDLGDGGVILYREDSETSGSKGRGYDHALPDRKRRCQSKGRKDSRKLYRHYLYMALKCTGLCMGKNRSITVCISR